MLSVYSTQKLKSNVFECADCLYRFTHRQRHLDKYPNHEVKKVTSEEIAVYPKQVIDYMRFKGMLSERGSEVLKQYADYCRDKLKKPLASFQFDAISRLFRGTHSLKRTDLLGDCITSLTTQSATIAKLMKSLFNITAYKFHPNACRKVWETYYDKNKEKIPGTLQKTFESNSGHSEKTRDKHYVAPPSDSDLQQLFNATDDIRKQFREKRKNPDFCSAINSEMPEYESENTAETPSIVSAGPPEPPCEPSSSKSPKIFDANSSTPVKSKKRTKNSNESDDDSDQASVDTRTEKDSIYRPPRHLKVERIPSGNKKPAHKQKSYLTISQKR